MSDNENVIMSQTKKSRYYFVWDENFPITKMSGKYPVASLMANGGARWRGAKRISFSHWKLSSGQTAVCWLISLRAVWKTNRSPFIFKIDSFRFHLKTYLFFRWKRVVGGWVGKSVPIEWKRERWQVETDARTYDLIPREFQTGNGISVSP